MNSYVTLVLIVLGIGIPLGVVFGFLVIKLNEYFTKSSLKDKKAFKLKSLERKNECKEAEIKRNDKQLQRESKYPKVFLRDNWDETTSSIITNKPEAIIKREDAIRHQPVITRERRDEEILTTDTTNREIERTRSVQPAVTSNINRRNNDDSPKPRENRRKFNWD